MSSRAQVCQFAIAVPSLTLSVLLYEHAIVYYLIIFKNSIRQNKKKLFFSLWDSQHCYLSLTSRVLPFLVINKYLIHRCVGHPSAHPALPQRRQGGSDQGRPHAHWYYLITLFIYVHTCMYVNTRT